MFILLLYSCMPLTKRLLTLHTSCPPMQHGSAKHTSPRLATPSDMVKNQPVVMTGWSVVDFWISVAGVVLVIIGQVLVITSTWQLGIIGTYLGDYFGMLMDAPVTAFPFSVLKHLMYVGSTVIYLGYGPRAPVTSWSLGCCMGKYRIPDLDHVL